LTHIVYPECQPQPFAQHELTLLGALFLWRTPVRRLKDQLKFWSLIGSRVNNFRSRPNLTVTSILSCTVSEILRVFVLLAPPLFHRNFGGVPVAPDRPCWGKPEQKP